MAFSEITEILVCVFAVWGVYCIFRSFVIWCLPRNNVSVAVHTFPEQTEYELYSSLREAQLLSEGKTEFCGDVVVLVDTPVSEQELEKITDMGTSVYLNYDIYGKRQT